MNLSLLFNEYRTAHHALMRNLDKIAQKIIADYNKNKRWEPKLQGIRFQISCWHPDQKPIRLTVQARLKGYHKFSIETIQDMDEFLKKVTAKYLSRQKGFEINIYFQTVNIFYSYDD